MNVVTKQAITAVALIHHEFDGVTKVFLAKRADTKAFLPGVYEVPGGHIELGEEIVTGLKREFSEEFGVQISVGDPFYVFDYINDVTGTHSVEIMYLARLVGSPDDITLRPEDHSVAGWFAVDEVAQAYSDLKGGDDPEFVGVRRGCELLRGGKHKLG